MNDIWLAENILAVFYLLVESTIPGFDLVTISLELSKRGVSVSFLELLRLVAGLEQQGLLLFPSGYDGKSALSLYLPI